MNSHFSLPVYRNHVYMPLTTWLSSESGGFFSNHCSQCGQIDAWAMHAYGTPAPPYLIVPTKRKCGVHTRDLMD